MKLIVYNYDTQAAKYKISTWLENPIYYEYTLNYSDLDSAQLVVSLSKQNTEHLKKGSIVVLENDICMLVHSIKFSTENKATVWGSLCDEFLSKRCLYEQLDFVNASIYDVFIGTDGIFSKMTAIESMEFTVENLPSSTYTGTIEPGNILDITKDICSKFELGFKVRAKQIQDSTELVLTCTIYAGRDKSEKVFMSREYDSISSFEYTEEAKDEVTTVKVLGKNGITVDVTVDDQTAATRSEYLLDCSNDKIDVFSMAEWQYRNYLRDKGRKIISDHQTVINYTGNYTGKTFEVNQDFDIGDIVTVSDYERSFDTVQKICNIRVQVDSSGRTLNLSFGEVKTSLPKVIDELSKKLEEVINKTENIPDTVGEKVGYNNEIFSCYKDTPGGTYKRNKINATSASHGYSQASGYSNEIDRSKASSVSGYNNKIDRTNANFTVGHDNESKNNNGITCGNNNSPFGDNGICFGTNNSGTCTNGLMGGENIQALMSAYLMLGYNLINNSAYESFLMGWGIENYGSRNMLMGRGINVPSANPQFANDVTAFGYYPEDIVVPTVSSPRPVLVIGAGEDTNRKTILLLDHTGNLTITGQYLSTAPADYAEYLEWKDGNSNDEDRRGLIVTLSNNKIIPATGDNFIGAVSSNPVIAGNAYERYWHGKYETDIFGSLIYDKKGNPIISKEFDPSLEYIPRRLRKEWSPVGLVGIVVIRDNGACSPGDYVAAQNGFAIPSKSPTKIQVMNRVSDACVRCFIR